MSTDGETGAPAATVSSMLYDHHLRMAKSKYAQPPGIIPISTMFLGLRATTSSCMKGIKLGPEIIFRYGSKPMEENNKRCLLYLYEAGLDPQHVKHLHHVIKIYVKHRKDTLLVGTLSAARPWIQLELTLGEGCELTHTSDRKTVLFNGFLLSLAKSPKSVVKQLPGREVWSNTDSVTLDANKELWVVEVLPSEKLSFNPVDDGKEYHLLQVYSMKNTNENISLHVCCNKKTELLGELVAGCNRIRLHSIFDDMVMLSHTSNTSVFFSGYSVLKQRCQFKLKELNVYAGDPEKDRLKSSPKISLDPEYQRYKAKAGKVRIGTTPKQQTATAPKKQATCTPEQREVNLVSMSLLTAPLIFDRRASCQLFTAEPRGLFWVPNQETTRMSSSEESDTSREDIATTSCGNSSSSKAGQKRRLGTIAASQRIFGRDAALQSHEKAKHA